MGGGGGVQASKWQLIPLSSFISSFATHSLPLFFFFYFSTSVFDSDRHSVWRGVIACAWTTLGTLGIKFKGSYYNGAFPLDKLCPLQKSTAKKMQNGIMRMHMIILWRIRTMDAPELSVQLYFASSQFNISLHTF